MGMAVNVETALPQPAAAAAHGLLAGVRLHNGARPPEKWVAVNDKVDPIQTEEQAELAEQAEADLPERPSVFTPVMPTRCFIVSAASTASWAHGESPRHSANARAPQASSSSAAT